MRGLREIFLLELRSLVRSKTLLMLSLASILWVFAIGHFATGDGTVAGARILTIRYALGGAFALTLVSLLASATGSLAGERTAKRLALTRVRPVRSAAIVVGKGAALVLVGAVSLLLACLALPLVLPPGSASVCRHVVSPVLPSVRDEALQMYDAYMKSPETPEAIRRAKRETILRILETKAVDRYEVVRTNAVGRWRFAVPAALPDGTAVRLKFAGEFGSRQNLVGTFRMDGCETVLSNMTEAILEVPLVRRGAAGGKDRGVLSFENRGRGEVMLRPRQDLSLLLPADAFAWNLVRAYVELVATLTLVIFFGLFLSAALSRPVALFTAIALLILGEMSPGVVSSYSGELEAGLADRAGLAIARVASDLTRPISSIDPISRLAEGTCVEPREVGRVVLQDMLVAALLLSLLAGFALARHDE